MEKKARGSYDFKADNEKGMIMTRWNDNNVVTLLSNKYGVEPLGQPADGPRKKDKELPFPSQTSSSTTTAQWAVLIAWTRMWACTVVGSTPRSGGGQSYCNLLTCAYSRHGSWRKICCLGQKSTTSCQV